MTDRTRRERALHRLLAERFKSFIETIRPILNQPYREETQEAYRLLNSFYQEVTTPWERLSPERREDLSKALDQILEGVPVRPTEVSHIQVGDRARPTNEVWDLNMQTKVGDRRWSFVTDIHPNGDAFMVSGIHHWFRAHELEVRVSPCLTCQSEGAPEPLSEQEGADYIEEHGMMALVDRLGHERGTCWSEPKERAGVSDQTFEPDLTTTYTYTARTCPHGGDLLSCGQCALSVMFPVNTLSWEEDARALNLLFSLSKDEP